MPSFQALRSHIPLIEHLGMKSSASTADVISPRLQRSFALIWAHGHSANGAPLVIRAHCARCTSLLSFTAVSVHIAQMHIAILMKSDELIAGHTSSVGRDGHVALQVDLVSQFQSARTAGIRCLLACVFDDSFNLVRLP